MTVTFWLKNLFCGCHMEEITVDPTTAQWAMNFYYKGSTSSFYQKDSCNRKEEEEEEENQNSTSGWKNNQLGNSQKTKTMVDQVECENRWCRLSAHLAFSGHRLGTWLRPAVRTIVVSQLWNKTNQIHWFSVMLRVWYMFPSHLKNGKNWCNPYRHMPGD